MRRGRWGGQASFREHTVRRWRWGLASFAAAAGCDSLSGELQTAPNVVGDFIATGPRTPESNEADRTPPGTRPVSLVFFPNRERAIVLLASFPSFSLRLSRRSSGGHGRGYTAPAGLIFSRELAGQHPFSTSIAVAPFSWVAECTGGEICPTHADGRSAIRFWGHGVGFRQNGCSTPRISAPPPLELFLPPLEGWSKKLNSSSLPGQFRSTFSTQPSLAISNKLACQQRAGSIYSFRCHPRNNVF